MGDGAFDGERAGHRRDCVDDDANCRSGTKYVIDDRCVVLLGGRTDRLQPEDVSEALDDRRLTSAASADERRQVLCDGDCHIVQEAARPRDLAYDRSLSDAWCAEGDAGLRRPHRQLQTALRRGAEFEPRRCARGLQGGRVGYVVGMNDRERMPAGIWLLASNDVLLGFRRDLRG